MDHKIVVVLRYRPEFALRKDKPYQMQAAVQIELTVPDLKLAQIYKQKVLENFRESFYENFVKKKSIESNPWPPVDVVPNCCVFGLTNINPIEDYFVHLVNVYNK